MDGASTDAHLDVYLDVGASTALSGPSQMHGNPLTNSEGTISLPSKSESDVPQSPALVASNGTSSSRRRYRPKLTIDPHALLTPNYPSDDGERTPTPHTHSGGDEIVEVQRELVLQYTPAPFSAPAPDVSPASTKSHGSTASRRSTGTYPNRNSRRRAHWTDALLAAEKTYAFRPRPGSSGSDGRLRANSVSSKVSHGRRPSHSSSGRPHWTDALLPVVPPRLPKPPAPDPPSSPGSSEQVGNPRT
ncbi:hypothetical protein BS17DRAFT_583597 [Gyrodon lividus]|nr:hypothetical protein BS17DRAFT_583597 [Gyrodon lividus]